MPYRTERRQLIRDIYLELIRNYLYEEDENGDLWLFKEEKPKSKLGFFND